MCFLDLFPSTSLKEDTTQKPLRRLPKSRYVYLTAALFVTLQIKT